MLFPMPRMRLYTTLASYMKVASSALMGSIHRGDDVGALERAVTSSVGSSHAVGMPQARVGIYLAVKELVRPGAKVILSPYTISDVVNMVIAAGAIPVFADIERKTCNIDPAQVADLIDDDTGAVLVTHFYGLACDVEKIIEICKPRGVPVIEDAAQAFGTKIGDRYAGTLGDVGIFSYGMIKNVTSFYGGMVVTRDKKLADDIRAVSSTYPDFQSMPLIKRVIKALILDVATYPPVFKLFTYWIFRFGHLNNIDALKQKMKVDINPVMRREIPENYQVRLTPVQARVALQQLPLVDGHTQARIAAAQMYHEGLKDVEGLILPPLLLDGAHNYTYYPIQYDGRDRLVDYCMLHFRDIAASHHKNCASMACFRDYQRDCPNSEMVANSLIYLPTYPTYSKDDIKHNIWVIRNFFEREC